MNEAKHTPGHWETRPGFSEDEIDIFVPNPKLEPPFYESELATVRVDEDERDEGEANASLIAAAPGLLEALKNIENDDGRIPETIWKMRNDAISKAEGKP